MRDMTEFLHLNELDNYFEEEIRRHYNPSTLTTRIYFFSLRYEKLTVLRSDIKFFLRIVEDKKYEEQALALLESVNKVIAKTIRKLHKYTEERDWLGIALEDSRVSIFEYTAIAIMKICDTFEKIKKYFKKR